MKSKHPESRESASSLLTNVMFVRPASVAFCLAVRNIDADTSTPTTESQVTERDDESAYATAEIERS